MTMTAENTKSSVESLEESAKKQSKWSQEEDAVIIDSRGKGVQWNEISKLLPGRSATSCRLHYQNYLERPEWDEDKKDTLARLYERYADPCFIQSWQRKLIIKDSKQKCGPQSPKKWKFHGEP